MKINDFSLWTALVTPLTPSLTVDFKSLKNLIFEQNDAKNGLLILGSTAEALNLSTEVKKSIVEFTLSLDLDVPVMIGIGGHDLISQKKWLSWLETHNKIDAYLMVTPIYAKPGEAGQYLWFKNLMDQSTKPVMLYNVPGRSGTELSFSAVEKLKNHKNFWAIKEASGSVLKMQQYLKSCGHSKVFCGDDGLLLDFTNAGACGLVSVASNTWPKQTNLYVEKCLNNSLASTDVWTKAADSLFITSNPVPAKALLAFEKRISSDTMMPPLSRQDLKNLDLLKQSSENINKWYELNK